MKKVIYITLLLLTFDCAIRCQNQFAEVQAPTSNALYSGCAYYYPGSGYAMGIWVCGAGGTVYRGRMTYNSISWINSSGNLPSNITLVTISALDSVKALCGGNSGGISFIYITTNGGANWVQTFSENGGRINALWMRNSAIGIEIGNPVGGRWSIWRTVNGGLNWDSTGRYLVSQVAETGFNNSLWCMGDTVFFGTNGMRVYYSQNFGSSWTTRITPADTVVPAIFWDNYGPQILSAGGTTAMMTTTNFGSNWTTLTGIPGTGNVTGICSYTPGAYDLSEYYLVVTKANKIYQGSYTGPFWNAIATASSGNFTYVFQKRSEPPPQSYQPLVPMVALRDNGGVSICYSCRWGGLGKYSDEIPASFSLYQNYPNPFNPSTKIKFDVPVGNGRDRSVMLRIYDALGQDIAVLVNEQLQPGTYEVDWNAADMPSGIYYYTLASGELSQTKKMVLIK